MKKIIYLAIVTILLSGCTIVGINNSKNEEAVQEPKEEIVEKVVMDKEDEAISKEIENIKIEENFGKLVDF